MKRERERTSERENVETEQVLLSCSAGPVSATFSLVSQQSQHSSYQREPDIHTPRFPGGKEIMRAVPHKRAASTYSPQIKQQSLVREEKRERFGCFKWECRLTGFCCF
ncbi:hypothetical protein QQF64_030103 [Cirrhinus molitorella]|uniref:Uncharacterized protein n=1 Tax=Cirrhinus molitorella TaxID=172907 RepID=A0ABR3N2J5_9TELE